MDFPAGNFPQMAPQASYDPYAPVQGYPPAPPAGQPYPQPQAVQMGHTAPAGSELLPMGPEHKAKLMDAVKKAYGALGQLDDPNHTDPVGSTADALRALLEVLEVLVNRVRMI